MNNQKGYFHPFTNIAIFLTAMAGGFVASKLGSDKESDLPSLNDLFFSALQEHSAVYSMTIDQMNGDFNAVTAKLDGVEHSVQGGMSCLMLAWEQGEGHYDAPQNYSVVETDQVVRTQVECYDEEENLTSLAVCSNGHELPTGHYAKMLFSCMHQNFQP